VYLFFPETNGRTLEEVDEIFLKSDNIFDSVKVANAIPRHHVAKHGMALETGGAGLAGRENLEKLGGPVEEVERTSPSDD
jgi:hypothetical protein